MSRLFDNYVTLEGTRGSNPRVHLTVRGCPMDGGLNDPLDDGASGTKLRRMTFVIKVRDLATVVPQIGDKVTTTDGKRFAVYAVQPFYNREYILDCRSC